MIKLTKKQTALLEAIGEDKFSFFDDGIQEGSGIWMNVLTDEAGSMEEIAKNPKGVATVASSLVKKGFLTSTTDADPDGAWLALTEFGATFINEMMDLKKAQAEAIDPTEEEAPVQEELDLIGEVEEAAEEAAEETETESPEDLLGDVEVAQEEALPEGQTWKDEDWTDEHGTEWTETTYQDGSRTIRRRRKVSGSWRTDFWGAEHAGDAEHPCLSRDVKAAKLAGMFIRPTK